MFLMTLMTKKRPSSSCLPMCLTAMLHSGPSESKRNPHRGLPRQSAKRWTDRLFRFYRRNPSTGAWDIFKAQRNVLFGFKTKLKWTIFINYYARSHILLTSGTHPSSVTKGGTYLWKNWQNCWQPLCCKAFSGNAIPRQQHWANSVQKLPSNHLFVIGQQLPNSWGVKLPFHSETEESHSCRCEILN